MRSERLSQDRYLFGAARIVSEYRLDEMIGDIIGKDSRLFTDLAAYSVIAENNAGQYYPG